jgi:hypothetical protein
VIEDAGPEIGSDAAADCGSVLHDGSATAAPELLPDAAADCGSDEVSTLPQSASLQSAGDATAIVREPHISEPVNNLENPLKSPLGETAAGLAKEEIEEDRARREAAESDLQRYRTIYPEPSNRPEEVSATVLQLPAARRELLLRGAQGVRECRRVNPRKPIPDAAKFARNEALWEEYGRLAPLPPLPPPKFVPSEGMHARAWLVFWRIIGISPPRISEQLGQPGFFVKNEVPPCGLGYARFDPDASWPRFEAKSANYAAWGKKIKDWAGFWPQPERVATGEMIEHKDASGRPFTAPKRIDARRFPSAWPLSNAAAASPDEPMTTAAETLTDADDERFLAQGGLR